MYVNRSALLSRYSKIICVLMGFSSWQLCVPQAPITHSVSGFGLGPEPPVLRTYSFWGLYLVFCWWPHFIFQTSYYNLGIAAWGSPKWTPVLEGPRLYDDTTPQVKLLQKPALSVRTQTIFHVQFKNHHHFARAQVAKMLCTVQLGNTFPKSSSPVI